LWNVLKRPDFPVLDFPGRVTNPALRREDGSQGKNAPRTTKGTGDYSLQFMASLGYAVLLPENETKDATVSPAADVQPPSTLVAVALGALKASPLSFLFEILKPIAEKISPRRALLFLSGCAVLSVLVIYVFWPKLSLVANEVAARYVREQRYSAALATYAKAVEINPDDAVAHYNLGAAYERFAEFDRAADEYNKAIELDDRLYAAYNNLARIYLCCKPDLTKATLLLQRALPSAPAESQVQYALHKNLGWAFYKAGNAIRAEQELRKAIAASDQGAAAHCLLGYVLDAENKQAEANQHWLDCKSLGDANPLDVEPEWMAAAQKHVTPQAAK
jgi:Flp pilus assembly protein TadD